MILPVTYLPNGHKQHHRMTDTQEMMYQCEGDNCQYCKEEVRDKEDREKESKQ